MTDEEFERRAKVMEAIDTSLIIARDLVLDGHKSGIFSRLQCMWFDTMMDMYDSWHDECFTAWTSDAETKN